MKKWLFAMVLIPVLAGCDSKRRQDEYAEQWQNLHNKTKRETDVIDAETEGYRRQLVALQFGTEAAQLWDKCKIAPKNPAHERQCKALHDKYEKYIKTQDAETQKQAAAW